jgi:hypothetical protein
MERDPEDFDVNYVRISLRKQPEVVSKHNARDQVYDVMTPQADHESELEDHGYNAEEGKLVPLMGLEFTETDHATTNVTREKEIISLAIRNSN